MQCTPTVLEDSRTTITWGNTIWNGSRVDSNSSKVLVLKKATIDCTQYVIFLQDQESKEKSQVYVVSTDVFPTNLKLPIFFQLSFFLPFFSSTNCLLFVWEHCTGSPSTTLITCNKKKPLNRYPKYWNGPGSSNYWRAVSVRAVATAR